MRVNVLALSFVSAAVVNAQNYASPPYYPTPKGGWLPEWSASYDKARALVSRMTLAGKVNITTATGWQMVRILLNLSRPIELVNLYSYRYVGTLCWKYWPSLRTLSITLCSGWASWCTQRGFDYSFPGWYNDWWDLGCRFDVCTRKGYGRGGPWEGCACASGAFSGTPREISGRW